VGDAEGPRVAVVTGAAGGIGRATAERLLASGCSVVVADLDEAAAERTAAELDPAGSGTLAVGADVTDSRSVGELMDATVRRFGGMDVLVNNAGRAGSTATVGLTDDAWHALLEVNLTGTLLCSRAAHPALARSPAPAIVNVASVAGVVGMRQRAGYSASKAGVIGLTRALAIEWAADGIRVNAVAPGYVRTAMIEQQAAKGVYDLDEMSARVPLGRLCGPSEVAAVVVFLASADASYVTGQNIVIDGGMTVDGRT
jgi:NAD(P)-dependent dehydrogenase (short-subunit alcohol dehydrogenase family)